jgi:hypothetical protein
MNGKIVVGSFLIIVFIALVPATNAIEFQIGNNDASHTLISYQFLRQMDTRKLVTYIQNLAQNYPEIETQFLKVVHDIQNTTEKTDQRLNGVNEKNQGPRPGDTNQTLLEKIFWKIYNYRILRLLISLVLFLKFQSKFTLLRSTTWAIRVLRWVKIGILLGYIDPSQQQNQTPNIGFQQDLLNHTLTVTSTSASDILWSDIAEIGSGSCDPFPNGTVVVGDIIANCSGILVFQYLPTYEVLGVYEFD